MAFQYVEGDFPEGTFAECKAGDWVLVLDRGGLFKAPQRVALKGQVRSAEIVRTAEEEAAARGAGGFGGGGTAQQVAQIAGAALGGLLAESLGNVGVPWSQKAVPVLCVLKDGRFFVANVSRKNYEWLKNQCLVSQTALRFRHADFAGAAMAMCALMATLDGWVDGSRKARLAPLLESDERLQLFPKAELEEKFVGFCRALLSDAATGRKMALEWLGKLEGRDDLARDAVRLGLATRGDIDPLDAREQKIVREVCAALQIYPGEFGLFYT